MAVLRAWTVGLALDDVTETLPFPFVTAVVLVLGAELAPEWAHRRGAWREMEAFPACDTTPARRPAAPSSRAAARGPWGRLAARVGPRLPQPVGRVERLKACVGEADRVGHILAERVLEDRLHARVGGPALQAPGLRGALHREVPRARGPFGSRARAADPGLGHPDRQPGRAGPLAQGRGRLGDRATVPGASSELAGLSQRYKAQAIRLAGEVEDVRASLRAQEARTEQLRAGAAGA